MGKIVAVQQTDFVHCCANFPAPFFAGGFVGFGQNDVGNHIVVDDDTVRRDPGVLGAEDGDVVAESLAEVEAIR